MTTPNIDEARRRLRESVNAQRELRKRVKRASREIRGEPEGEPEEEPLSFEE